MLPFLIAGGLQALSTAFSIMSSSARAAAAKSQAQRNAEMSIEAAADAYARGRLTDLRAAMRGSAVVAAQRVELSGTGADMNIGSALDVQLNARVITDMDREVIRNNAWREAYGHQVRAQIMQQQGAYAEAEGRGEAIGAVLSGLGKIAGIAAPKLINAPDTSTPEMDPDDWEKHFEPLQTGPSY